MDDTPDWETMVRGFCAGDPACSRQFWNRFGEPLQRIAERNLEGGLARRVGPEDVVQSACRTFFRRVRNGLLELTDQESLWRLLCAITLNKVRQQRRFHHRKKRGLAAEQPLQAGEDREWFLDVEGSDPGPDLVAEWGEQMEQLLAPLDEEQRRIVDLRLQGHTQEEIAAQLEISERTVRRLIKTIQARFTRMLETDT